MKWGVQVALSWTRTLGAPAASTSLHPSRSQRQLHPPARNQSRCLHTMPGGFGGIVTIRSHAGPAPYLFPCSVLKRPPSPQHCWPALRCPHRDPTTPHWPLPRSFSRASRPLRGSSWACPAPGPTPLPSDPSPLPAPCRPSEPSPQAQPAQPSRSDTPPSSPNTPPLSFHRLLPLKSAQPHR